MASNGGIHPNSWWWGSHVKGTSQLIPTHHPNSGGKANRSITCLHVSIRCVTKIPMLGLSHFCLKGTVGKKSVHTDVFKLSEKMAALEERKQATNVVPTFTKTCTAYDFESSVIKKWKKDYWDKCPGLPVWQSQLILPKFDVKDQLLSFANGEDFTVNGASERCPHHDTNWWADLLLPASHCNQVCLSQKLCLLLVNYRVSHEPIKQLKTAKEKRTKNRLTKKPQKWNQGQITLGLTTEISLNPRLPPGLILECAGCLQSLRLQACVLKPGTFLSFLPCWFQLHLKIRPYTRCNLRLTLLHTCRHCHSNLWQTESQVNRVCVGKINLSVRYWAPCGYPRISWSKGVHTHYPPATFHHSMQLHSHSEAFDIPLGTCPGGSGMLNWMQWDECSHASYPPGKPTQEPERGKWDNSWSMASLGWNKSKNSRDVQVNPWFSSWEKTSFMLEGQRLIRPSLAITSLTCWM